MGITSHRILKSFQFHLVFKSYTNYDTDQYVYYLWKFEEICILYFSVAKIGYNLEITALIKKKKSYNYHSNHLCH